jgi:peptidoglycan/LPS O-acetylase OafA/YrhL
MSRTAPSLEQPPAVVTDSSQERLFVDAMRVAVIVMVIVHHAAQAYGPNVT